MVRGSESIVHLIKWVEGKMRKMLGMLAVNNDSVGSENDRRWEL
jgi:hypothetical protein